MTHINGDTNKHIDLMPYLMII